MKIEQTDWERSYRAVSRRTGAWHGGHDTWLRWLYGSGGAILAHGTEPALARPAEKALRGEVMLRSQDDVPSLEMVEQPVYLI
jgi:hypothetical protein